MRPGNLRNAWTLPAMVLLLFTARLAGAEEGAQTTVSATILGATAAPAEYWVSVRVNQAPQSGEALLYKTEQGVLYARPQDIVSWKLPVFVAEPDFMHRDQPLVRIGNRPGLAVRFDAEKQELDLTVDAWLLPEQRSAKATGRDPASGGFAMFGNYQVYGLQGPVRRVSGRFEVGASRDRTSLRTDWLADESGHGLRRLDTTMQIESPSRRERVQLGDTVSVAGVTGRSWRYAGVQWSSALEMAPELPPFALPSAEGVATVPSTVDLYVNGALQESREVAPGPYSIADIVVPSGPGTVMLLVRDAMGREQRIEQRFLATPLLLAPGATTHSVQAGFMRYRYGVADFDYGSGFVSLAARRGVSQRITAESQLEADRHVQSARLGAAFRLGDAVVARTGLALGSDREGTGAATDLTVDWQSRWFSLSTQARRFGADFIELGAVRTETRMKREWAAQFSPRLPFAGSAGIVHSWREGRDARDSAMVSTFFMSFARVFGGSVTLDFSRVRSSGTHLRGSMTFVRSLGPNRSTSAALSRDARGSSLDWQIGRSAPRDAGWGWQFATRQGPLPQVAARLDSRTRLGDGDIEARSDGHGRQLRASWSGGWLWTDDTFALSAPLTQAAALIEAPGVSGARVLHDGQDLGRTDSRGRLVATDLRPYQQNRLRLDVSDVSLGAWVSDSEVAVEPYRNGVLKVRFATQANAGTLTLLLARGGFVPAGARVQVGAQSYPVGDAGRVSLPLSPQPVEARVSWLDGSCTALLQSAENEQVTCREASP